MTLMSQCTRGFKFQIRAVSDSVIRALESHSTLHTPPGDAECSTKEESQGAGVEHDKILLLS